MARESEIGKHNLLSGPQQMWPTPNEQRSQNQTYLIPENWSLIKAYNLHREIDMSCIYIPHRQWVGPTTDTICSSDHP